MDPVIEEEGDCAVCCKLIMGSILSVVVIGLIVADIFDWFNCDKPSPPKFRVDSISFPLFNFSSSSNSTTSGNLITVLINVQNQGWRFCYYQSMEASLSYKNVTLASSSNILRFGPSKYDDGVPINVSMVIDNNYLNTTNHEAVNSLALDFRTNYAAEFGVNIKGMNWEFCEDEYETWFENVKVSCEGLKVGFQPNTTTSTANLLGGPKECDSQ